MSVLPILQWPDPRLNTRCDPVGAGDISALIADMFETMYAAPGRGLAGPQVGAMLRVFVMDVGWKDGEKTPMACIDPEIIWRSEETATGPEGCLSMPGVLAQVTRPAEIRLAYTDQAGVLREDHLTGFAAICAQHEFDHLNGTMHFAHLPETERDRLLADYGALS